MENINDYHRYTQLMRNGFYDKLFFIDKLFHPWHNFVDYGCADGHLTKMIAQIFPDKTIAGYDQDESMINLARYSGSLPENVAFLSRPELLTQTQVIFLSSVIHEVYSYSKTPDNISDFWEMVFNKKRRYVIVRDMMTTTTNLLNADRKFMTYAWARIEEYCNQNNCIGELKRFEERFATASVHPKLLIHFLLKMPYISSPNWNREIHENYLPLSMGEIQSMMPTGWTVEYEEAYKLPYLDHWWKQNLQIDLPYTTHGKIIFHNKNK